MIPGKVVRLDLEDSEIGMTMTSCDDSVIVEIVNYRSGFIEKFLMNVADCMLLDAFIAEVTGRDA